MSNFFHGMKLALPIVLGYLPIAISFGVIAKLNELSSIATILMSATVYAGASQFLAAEMYSNTSIFEVIFVVFLINLRHMVMTYSLLPFTNEIPLIKKVFIFMGITDETYAVISLKEDNALKTVSGIVGLVFFCYMAWVVGTMMGVFLSSAIPNQITNSMGIAIYALFIGLLVQALLIKPQYLYVVIIAVILNILITTLANASLALFMSIVLSPLLFILIHKKIHVK